ncbi:hypothetical protein F5984_03625 [Rudanella paleaurantiibacter]|uniref:Uncharacterized protein n=1 Tax=Rudanella paleaurantiibacter TaxID=2614655 RepID=A0A7J5U5W7_9BACT|nr:MULTISPECIES: hypothetical protein [Rudanella]KAB7733041.1 hypothetical protein F5984_03625 [Rudanella paleaurantiibacter]
MHFDDEDDDAFDWEEFERNYDPEEAQREMEAENRRIEQLPILRKANEILEITQAIVGTIDDEDDVLMMSEQMMANAMMLPTKIVGAEGADLYTLRMENAVIIKTHARELLTQTNYLRAEKLSKPVYIQLLRDEIENFRVLFVEWVNSFDKSNDIPDDWGLFQ